VTRAVMLAGLRKRLFDLALAARIAVAAVVRFGLAGAFRQLRAYLRDNRNVVAGAADRYVRRGRDTYAASALPPLASRAFLDYLVEEVATFNGRRLSPMVMALVSVSSRCPYRCRHCYAADQLRAEEAVPLDRIVAAVADVGRLGLPNVFLTGGEPMMRRDDLPAILAPARDAGVASWLVSTGFGMDRDALGALLPFGLAGVVISLDSRDPERTNAAKGHPEAFARATAAIRAASDIGLLVSVDCVAGPEVVDPAEYRSFLRFLASLGVHFVNFLPLQRTGGVLRHGVPAIGTDGFRRLEALMDASNRGRANRDLPIAYSPMVFEHTRGCVAGQQFVYVDPLGDVRPCPFLPEPAGNVRDVPLREIVERVRGGGERAGCYTAYEGLPAVTRLEGKPKAAAGAPEEGT